MSVSGITSTGFSGYNTQSVQKKMQFQTEFQQLGQDLQSGNLSEAQADFAALQQLGPQSKATPSPESSNPITEEFNQLTQDLQSGNVSASQQDFAAVQKDLQNLAAQPHRHHHGGGQGVIGQLLNQVGQALQLGNLSSAQQAYSTLQQDF